ncbi:Hypothetical predicted protein [Cloeon dipterum]|uniref:Gem-associated protein 7 n=1 Tax=Cloeon dipterum TaxID=197152 RepID=A0A8S1E0E5_9INSE|nr:Hypothetical predicted protein [Cloeon dipterum]
METEAPKEDNSEAIQKLRTEMRERFLRIMTALVGQKCEFTMLEKTVVRAELKGCDRDVQNFCVSNLQTALGVLPQAILRAEDIISVQLLDFPADK